MSTITVLVIPTCLTGGVLIALWIFGSRRFIRGIETPKYSVLDRKSGYEIREYEPYIVARTDVHGSFGGSLNQGFRIIADYIFGNNVSIRSAIMQETSSSRSQESSEIKGEKIPMTAPVISEKIHSLDMQGKYSISFVMPSGYSLETIPAPRDGRVEIMEAKRHFAAVLAFSGYATEKRVLRKRRLLREMLTRDEIKTKHGYKVAQYNPPWTFPLMRRNEVIIELQDEFGMPKV